MPTFRNEDDEATKKARREKYKKLFAQQPQQKPFDAEAYENNMRKRVNGNDASLASSLSQQLGDRALQEADKRHKADRNYQQKIAEATPESILNENTPQAQTIEQSAFTDLDKRQQDINNKRESLNAQELSDGTADVRLKYGQQLTQKMQRENPFANASEKDKKAWREQHKDDKPITLTGKERKILAGSENKHNQIDESQRKLNNYKTEHPLDTYQKEVDNLNAEIDKLSEKLNTSNVVNGLSGMTYGVNTADGDNIADVRIIADDIQSIIDNHSENGFLNDVSKATGKGLQQTFMDALWLNYATNQHINGIAAKWNKAYNANKKGGMKAEDAMAAAYNNMSESEKAVIEALSLKSETLKAASKLPTNIVYSGVNSGVQSLGFMAQFCAEGKIFDLAAKGLVKVALKTAGKSLSNVSKARKIIKAERFINNAEKPVEWGNKSVGQLAKDAGKKLAYDAARSTGMTVMFPQTYNSMEERKQDKILSGDENYELTAKERAAAFADNWTENFSEMGLGRLLGFAGGSLANTFGDKFAGTIAGKAWKSAFNSPFSKVMREQFGIGNWLEEAGEEYFGAAIKTGFGYLLDDEQLKNAWKDQCTWDTAAQMAISFSPMFIAQSAFGIKNGLANRRTMNQYNAQKKSLLDMFGEDKEGRALSERIILNNEINAMQTASGNMTKQQYADSVNKTVGHIANMLEANGVDGEEARKAITDYMDKMNGVVANMSEAADRLKSMSRTEREEYAKQQADELHRALDNDYLYNILKIGEKDDNGNYRVWTDRDGRDIGIVVNTDNSGNSVDETVYTIQTKDGTRINVSQSKVKNEGELKEYSQQQITDYLATQTDDETERAALQQFGNVPFRYDGNEGGMRVTVVKDKDGNSYYIMREDNGGGTTMVLDEEGNEKQIATNTLDATTKITYKPKDLLPGVMGVNTEAERYFENGAPAQSEVNIQPQTESTGYAQPAEVQTPAGTETAAESAEMPEEATMQPQEETPSQQIQRALEKGTTYPIEDMDKLKKGDVIEVHSQYTSLSDIDGQMATVSGYATQKDGTLKSVDVAVIREDGKAINYTIPLTSKNATIAETTFTMVTPVEEAENIAKEEQNIPQEESSEAKEERKPITQADLEAASRAQQEEPAAEPVGETTGTEAENSGMLDDLQRMRDEESEEEAPFSKANVSAEADRKAQRKTLDVRELTGAQKKLMAFFEKRLGIKIVFVHDAAWHVNGCMDNGKNTLIINTAYNKEGIMWILGHEVSHKLRMQDEALYGKYTEAVKAWAELMLNEGHSLKVFGNSYNNWEEAYNAVAELYKEQIEKLDKDNKDKSSEERDNARKDYLEEELMAELSGMTMTANSREFMQALDIVKPKAEEKKGILRQIIDSLKGLVTLHKEAPEAVTDDMKAVNNAIETFTNALNGEKKEGKSNSETGKTKYSRITDKETAKSYVRDVLENTEGEDLPKQYNSVQEFSNDFKENIITPIKAIKVKDEVIRKIIRENRQSISGAVKPTLESPDLIIKDVDGGLLFIKVYKNGADKKINIAVVNKKDELEDYISSVHIKTDNNILNKIENGASLLRPEKGGDGKSQNNDAPFSESKDTTNSETGKENEKKSPKKMYSLVNTNQQIFVSNVERAVEAIKQDKATAEQWKAMVSKNGGLKAEEDKWMGLSDWLDSKKGEKLTKQDVLDYIRENDVQIEEVRYRDANNIKDFASLKKEYDNILRNDGYDAAWDMLTSRYGKEAENAFSDLGGELMIENADTASKLLKSEKPINDTRLDYTTAGLKDKREIALTVPTIEQYNEDDLIHFGDAGEGRAVAWIRFGDAKDTDGKKVLVIDEVQSKRHQDGREKGYDVVPDAPFRKTWHELAMKRMLRYAAENGYDKIAWTTGGQQADRYTLRKVADNITVTEDDEKDGNYYIYAMKNHQPIYESDSVSRDKVFDILGKDIATKAFDNMEDGESELYGDDMEFGGEGMKGFYDKMIPSFMDKYCKKWGTKTQDVTLDLPDEADRVMHSVDVTPAMKESVMEGQVKYSMVYDYNTESYLSERAYTAKRQGKYPANEFINKYHVKKADFGLLDMLGIIKSDEWHHTGKAYKKTDFYQWADFDDNYGKPKDITVNIWQERNGKFEHDGERVIDIASNYTDAVPAEGTYGDIYQKNKKQISGLIEDFKKNDWPELSAEQMLTMTDKDRDVSENGKKDLRTVADMFGETVSDTTLQYIKAQNPNIKYSKVTPAEDKAYMDAVESGDMETAQRMVEEAFMKAYPNTKVVDENGKPLVMYHNDRKHYNDFTDKLKDANTDRIYFTPVKDNFKDFSGDISTPAFLNITNPIYDNVEVNDWMPFGEHDGLILSTKDEFTIGDEYIVRNPEQIKSAETVTYDDNGKVIPLSERFNPRKSDIRYSKPMTYETLPKEGNYENGIEVAFINDKGEEEKMTIHSRFSDIDKKAAIPVILQSYSKDELRKIYHSFAPVSNVNTGEEIKFYAKGFEKNYRVGGNFAKVVPQLREICKSASLAYSQEDNLAGKERADGTIHKNHSQYIGFGNYINKVDINGEEYYVRLTVQREKNRTGLHSTMVTAVDLYKNPTNGEPGQPLSGKGELSISRISDAKLRKYLDISKNLEEKSKKSAEDKLSKAGDIHSNNFKKWFGDSKVVDENGNPLVVYHGSKKWNPLKEEKGKAVFKDDSFFTANKKYAERYGNTGAYYLSIKHPFDIRNKENRDIFTEYRNGHTPAKTNSGAMDWAEYDYEDFRDWLQENYSDKGYDGVILDEGGDTVEGNVTERGLSYVPFNANQIKSATDNNGEYSREENDVRLSKVDMGAISEEDAQAIKDTQNARIRLADTVARNSGIKTSHVETEQLPDLMDTLKDGYQVMTKPDSNRIYGINKGSEVFVNTDEMESDTRIGDMKQMWDVMCQVKNPALWQNGVALMKKTPLWNMVAARAIMLGTTESQVAMQIHEELNTQDGKKLIDEWVKTCMEADGMNDRERTLAALKLETYRDWCKQYDRWLEGEMQNNHKTLNGKSLSEIMDTPVTDLMESSEDVQRIKDNDTLIKKIQDESTRTMHLAEEEADKRSVLKDIKNATRTMVRLYYWLDQKADRFSYIRHIEKAIKKEREKAFLEEWDKKHPDADSRQRKLALMNHRAQFKSVYEKAMMADSAIYGLRETYKATYKADVDNLIAAIVDIADGEFDEKDISNYLSIKAMAGRTADRVAKEYEEILQKQRNSEVSGQELTDEERTFLLRFEAVKSELEGNEAYDMEEKIRDRYAECDFDNSGLSQDELEEEMDKRKNHIANILTAGVYRDRYLYDKRANYTIPGEGHSEQDKGAYIQGYNGEHDMYRTQLYRKLFGKDDIKTMHTPREVSDAFEARIRAKAEEYNGKHKDKVDTRILSELSHKVHGMVKYNQRFEREYKVIDKKTYNSFQYADRYWIPMRGWDEELYEQFGEDTANQRPDEKAKYRERFADDGLKYLYAMTEYGFRQGIYGGVKQAFVDLVMNNQKYFEQSGNTALKRAYRWIPQDKAKYAKELAKTNGTKNEGYVITTWKPTENEVSGESRIIDAGMILNDEVNNIEFMDTVNMFGKDVNTTHENAKKDHTITYKDVNGTTYRIMVSSKNFAEIMNSPSLRSKFSELKPVRFLARISRTIGALRTSKSIKFLLRNPVRDFLEAMVIEEWSPAYKWNYMKNVMKSMPQMFQMVARPKNTEEYFAKEEKYFTDHRDEAKKGNKRWDRYIERRQMYNEFHEWQNLGGVSGYTYNFGNVDKLIKNYGSTLRRNIPAKIRNTAAGTIIGNAAVNVAEKVEKFEEKKIPTILWNTLSLQHIATIGEVEESLIRFAVYKTLKDGYASVNQGNATLAMREHAAYQSKEATVNFSRHGSFTKGMNALFPFFTATVNALYREVRLAKKRPGVWMERNVIYAALGMASGMLPYLLGDDDDKEKYRRTSDYYKTRGFMPLSWTKTWFNGLFVPVPQSMYMWYGFGELVSEVMNGNMTKNEAKYEELQYILNSLPDVTKNALGRVVSYNRLTDQIEWGSDDTWESILAGYAPAVIEGLTALYFNENFMGSPILKKYGDGHSRAYYDDEDKTYSAFIKLAKVWNVMKNPVLTWEDYDRQIAEKQWKTDEQSMPKKFSTIAGTDIQYMMQTYFPTHMELIAGIVDLATGDKTIKVENLPIINANVARESQQKDFFDATDYVKDLGEIYKGKSDEALKKMEDEQQAALYKYDPNKATYEDADMSGWFDKRKEKMDELKAYKKEMEEARKDMSTLGRIKQRIYDDAAYERKVKEINREINAIPQQWIENNNIERLKHNNNR